MSEFYIKNRSGEFLPVNLNSYFTKDLNGKLVIVRVGTDDCPASITDVDETWESFRRADVLNDLEEVSIIVTPYQIGIDTVTKEEVEEKELCLQIKGGEDLSSLDESMKKIYKRLRNKFDNVVVLPSPLTLKEYKKVKDILKRCEIRRQRRSRTKG